MMTFLYLALMLTVPATIAFGRNPYARIVAAEVQLANFTNGLAVFKVDCGRYPSTEEGLAALAKCSPNIPSNQWHGPYLGDYPLTHKKVDQVSLDPWGHDYVYRCPGIHNTKSYDLYSCGADEVSKTGGDDSRTPDMV
jgi:general secretion pathway protein G